MSKVADKEKKGSSGTHVGVEITSEKYRLHQVPPQVRQGKNHIYDPVVLSLGPYHRGRQPQFQQVESLKEEVLHTMLGVSKDKTLLLFLDKISNRVDEIKNFYGAPSVPLEYTDKVLAEIMFRDGCFVLNYIEFGSGDYDKGDNFFRRLGMSGVAFMYRDFFMLENQIPLWIVKLLFNLINEQEVDDEWEALISKFLGAMNFGEDRITKVPWEEKEQEPRHLLEAHRLTLVNGECTTSNIDSTTTRAHHHRLMFRFFQRGWRKTCQSSNFSKANSQFRSVKDLKAKGIHFGPSSNCLKDIRFNSYLFYGKLQLPIWLVTNNSSVFFSNLIAFEMSPETDTDLAVTSYINFMKSLIEDAKDVKELREKDILFSLLASDEEVVRMYKEMDTYGMENSEFFHHVKERIDKHCDSRGKTWRAELIHTYFKTPWTAIALFAATFLLCLTFLQTYYTMNPVTSTKTD